MLRLARYLLVPFLVGAISLGAAWAGSVVAPAPVSTPAGLAAQATDVRASKVSTTGSAKGADAAAKAAGTSKAAGDAAAAVTAFAGTIPEGSVIAGASKVSIYPQPNEAAGAAASSDSGSTVAARSAVRRRRARTVGSPSTGVNGPPRRAARPLRTF